MQGGTINRACERNSNKGGRNLELKKERKKNEKTDMEIRTMDSRDMALSWTTFQPRPTDGVFVSGEKNNCFYERALNSQSIKVQVM